MKIELLNKIEETSQLLIQSISAFTDDQFNKIPFEGSWTPAQVTDHITKSLSGVAELLYANTKPTKRQAEEKSEAIKTMFLDFGSKMKSPEF
ncbi:MAG: DinB family protein, partial [Chitinophagaceae bacterium]